MNRHERFVRDAAAYVRWALAHDISGMNIVKNLAHDLRGMEGSDEGFTPRVTGFARREELELAVRDE